MSNQKGFTSTLNSQQKVKGNNTSLVIHNRLIKNTSHMNQVKNDTNLKGNNELMGI
jgi:hypothetical protein